ncbi:hypothetical protein GCM10022408_19190 [Hymenobacter fastidiosus]|uniref:CD-NTase-associated protein 12/Pycsar effector protein TIR domain-containing protein n=1 Tax=Hymenobacter fastidiosus TaxID=486264 RepID=A0ABP7S6W9_9BACT
MKKHKKYPNTRFSAEIIKEAYSKWLEITPNELSIRNNSKSIIFPNEQWEYDSDFEFYSDLQREHEYASLFKSKFNDNIQYQFQFDDSPFETNFRIEAPTRHEIEEVFYIIDKGWERFKLPENRQAATNIFIGHGRSQQWRDLKDHLSDKHEFKIVAYESGARAGHHIRDILDEMLTKSSFAILVMTAEDELAGEKMQARPNVIHETGLFQGKLGFSRAIVLLEEGAEEFSNLYGIQQIRYSKGNIKETFGEILATIKREFKQ